MTSDKNLNNVLPDKGSIALTDASCIVLLMDGEGRVMFLNPFGLDFFGYHDHEIIGQPAIGTIIPEKDHTGNDLGAMINDLLCRPEDYSHQINENRRKNGDRVWVVWSNRAFRDESGKVTHILCVGNDITDRKAFETVLEEARVQLTAKIQEQNTQLKKEVAERKKVQEALAESLDRYRLFSEISIEGILFHDNGIAIEVNDAFADLTECPREQLIGMDVIDRFVSPEDMHQVRQNINSNVEGVYEIKIRSATGRLFPAELRTRPGELAGRACRVVSVRDITNRKKTERQLIQSQKMEAVGTLAGGIAHDFNNMLAGIQGNVEIIRHQLSPKSTHQKRLAIINQIVQRGAKLSGQLLGYARGGQSEINEINLNRLVEDALEMFGHTQRHIDIQTRFSPDIPVVRGDRTQIEQVLLNLMINAVHAMPTGGKLFIETHATVLSSNDTRAYEIIPGPYAMLSVRDTGHGMDQKTQRQIFEPFFTTKAQGQGTGLGLASTYGIVKNHKGYIEVYSDLGEGSQFNVLLPAAGSTEKTAPAMDTSRKKGTETLLVVDDEPDFLDVGREMLLLLGYDVITAGNSDEAVAVFKKQAGSIKLVILDMIMPGSGVEDTIRRLREIDPTVRVLLSSGYSQNGEIARNLMRHCNGFIQKPFRLTSLSTKIRSLLGAAADENP
jgi:two-component system, cell cycle sensor histidine kinase and response regulator CckA